MTSYKWPSLKQVHKRLKKHWDISTRTKAMVWRRVAMKTSVFITLLEKPGASECEEFRTMNFINHVIKLLLSLSMYMNYNEKRTKYKKIYIREE